MTQPELGFKITGDPSGFSKAMQDVQNIYQTAQAKAAAAQKALDLSDARLAQAMAGRQTSLTAATQNRIEKAIAAEERYNTQVAKARDKALAQVIAAEQKLTSTVQSETARRVQLAKDEAAQRLATTRQAAGAFVGGLGGGPVGSLIGGLGPIALAAAAAAAIKALADAVHNLVVESHDLQTVTGGNIREVSTLIAVSKTFGITEQQLASSMKDLAGAIHDHPEAFEKMGVALVDAQGNARPLIDIFSDVRRVLSEARNDFDLITVAAALFGRGAIDMMPMLRASQDSIDTFAQSAKDAGAVLDDALVAKEREREMSLNRLGQSFQGLGNYLSGIFSPMITTIFNKLGQDADALGTEMDALLRKGMSFDEAVEKARADSTRRAAATELLTRLAARNGEYNLPPDANDRTGGGVSLGPIADLLKPGPSAPKGPAPRDELVDAIREHIDTIRAAADARQRELREALDADQKQKQSTLDLASASRSAVAETYAAAIDQIRQKQAAADRATRQQLQQIQDELAAREKLRDVNLNALQAEQKAADDAFSARQAQRDAEAQALQDKLAAIGAIDQAATDAAAVQQAQDAIAAEQGKDMQRIRSESLADYEKRVQDHNDQLARLDEDLAQAQKTEAENAQKATLQAKIDELERAGRADKAALTTFKANIDDQIAAIRTLADADKAATADRVEAIQRAQQAAHDANDDAIAGLEHEAKVRDDAFKLAIANLEDIKKASKEAADQQIADSQRVTDQILADLQKQIAARQPGAGVGATNAGGTVTIPGQSPMSSQDFAKHVQGLATLNDIYAAYNRITGNEISYDYAKQIAAKNLTYQQVATGNPFMFANGGEMVLSSPAAIVGFGGKVLGVAGEAGAETLTFTPGRGGRGGGDIVIVNDQPIILDGAVVGRSVGRFLADRYALRGGKRRAG